MLIRSLMCAGVFMICASEGLSDTISLDLTRYGTTYRASNNPGGAVTAHAAFTSPMFLVHGGSNIHRGYEVFDLSAVPTGSTITSVSFEFANSTVSGTPDVQVWGNYQLGEVAYDTYFAFNTNSPTLVSLNDAPFTSMTTDGSLFGDINLPTADATKSVDLSGNGGLAYFNSQIGNQVLLFTRLSNDLTDPNGSFGDGFEPASSTVHLRVDYTTAALSVPLPRAVLLAIPCLALLWFRRTRARGFDAAATAT